VASVLAESEDRSARRVAPAAACLPDLSPQIHAVAREVAADPNLAEERGRWTRRRANLWRLLRDG
jgi:hypothetical protein